MCPEELVLFATSLAIAIAKDRDTSEIDLLAIILSQTAGSLVTISYQRKQCEEQKDSETEEDTEVAEETAVEEETAVAEGTDSGTTSSIVSI